MRLCSGLLAGVLVVGLGASASAADPTTKVKIGKGGVSVEAGGTKVDVAGGDVDVETDGADVDVETDDADEAEATKGGELEIVGNGKKVEHTCGGASKGATSVSVTGNAHRVVLKGACASVTITGNNHDVAIDEVAAIIATGNNLKVTWKKATSGKEPKITRTGNGISIKKLVK